MSDEVTKNKKHFHERFINVDAIKSLKPVQLRWFTTAANCLIMFCMLTSLITHFVGIQLETLEGKILLGLEIFCFAVMIILGGCFVYLDIKNKIFKNRFIAPIFVTFYIALCLIMNLSAMQTTTFINTEDGVKIHIEYKYFLYIYLPIFIVGTVISMSGFVNFLGRYWKGMTRKQAELKHLEKIEQDQNQDELH